MGGNAQSINFTQMGEQMVYFDVRVKGQRGRRQSEKLRTSSGNEKADYEVELDIRNPNPPVTSITEITSARAAMEYNSSAIGVASTNYSHGRDIEHTRHEPAKAVELPDRIPAWFALSKQRRPMFPQLVLNQLMDLDDYKKRRSRKHPCRHQPAAEFQRPDGGFSYWPGMAQSDEWGNNYAGHFLVEAQNNGYLVSDYMLQQWKNYQRGKARTAGCLLPDNFYGGDLTQSYRLYTLALAKAGTGRHEQTQRIQVSLRRASGGWRPAYISSPGGTIRPTHLISGLGAVPRSDLLGITYGSDTRMKRWCRNTDPLLGQAKRRPKSCCAASAPNWPRTSGTAPKQRPTP